MAPIPEPLLDTKTLNGNKLPISTDGSILVALVVPMTTSAMPGHGGSGHRERSATGIWAMSRGPLDNISDIRSMVSAKLERSHCSIKRPMSG
jgi:hypothetical protein